MKKRIVLATRNADKVREIRAIFEGSGVGVELLGLDGFAGVPEVDEDGETLKANAVKKARTVGNHTGLPALAEDTGLFVDCLDGAPGVRSSRYADTDPHRHTATYDDNCRKLLAEMRGVPLRKRTARFTCVAAFYAPRLNKAYTRSGEVEGVITEKPSGDHGFGYDPVFLYPPLQKTFAEMTAEEKNRISHRFKAMKRIAQLMRQMGY